ncbi:MAG: ComEA family DNA-binding protein [Veillonella sp.]|uniref:ComEA family DNA-binding protein n=1 Tax=Veillonella sp. TaxID=1926307 RepID=UPI001D2D81C3|nr:ComEA family DNA-binding protein [Veillonella sp.]MBS7013904.1 ComEA family DNA-binding protein [Veillonella sp.]
MKGKLKPYMIIILILCVLVGIYFLWPIITDESDSVLAEGGIDGNSSISSVEQQPNKPIAYITGAVVSPGLYELESSATVGDIVKLAGGLLPYADVESINMAKPVVAGDHIHVIFNFHGNPEVLLRGNKININTATAKELDALPGIGPAMAKRIEEYRSQKGPFTSVEGIKGVKGIGDGVFKKIKDKITI